MGGIIIKTAEEIEAMRHAGEILTKTLDLMERSVRVGISTKELDKIAEDYIRSHEGCTPGFKGYHGFTGSICTSINEEAVHGIPSEDRILEDGDIIGVDCGVYYKGLHTDACRTFGCPNWTVWERGMDSTVRPGIGLRCQFPWYFHPCGRRFWCQHRLILVLWSVILLRIGGNPWPFFFLGWGAPA